MQPANTIALGSRNDEDGHARSSVALAVWGLTVSMLFGAVVVAGVAMTALRLQMMK